MQVTNEKVLDRFIRKHADSRGWLAQFLAVARAASWQKIQDVKTAFPAVDGGVKVDSGGTVTVFNVCGNKYRLIVSIVYQADLLAILEILTQAEYSADRWKGKY